LRGPVRAARPGRWKEVTTNRAAFIHSSELEKYSYPSECPFNASRAGKARQILVSMGLLGGRGHVEVAPEPATREELLTFHTPEYLAALQAAPMGQLDIEGLWMGLGTAETPIFLGLWEYATLAAGATLLAARRILAGESDVAFNPSGGYHHAFASRAAGFCFVNDVVLACERLAAAGKRVFFLDVDAHHADGVQAAFYDRRDVMTLSFHESGKTLFPGTGFEDETGVGAGEGYSANVPLPARTYDEAFLKAFGAVAVPLIGAYGPDVIVLELGMDGLSGDPLTHLALTNNAYAEVVERVLAFRRPVLATGGGGYHVENTARGWALAWSILSGQDHGSDDLQAGLGGVMMASTDWLGGLRDRALVASAEQRAAVEPAVEQTIENVKRNVFAAHGL